MKHIDIVFDGPPSRESGRFVEVENERGHSINFGRWVKRPDGYWVLRFADPDLTELYDLTRYAIDSARCGKDGRTVCAHSDVDGEWIYADDLDAALARMKT